MSKINVKRAIAPDAVEPPADPAYSKMEWEGRQVDWLLQWFVRVASQANLEVGITLSVRGHLVSGLLISPQAYFTLLAEQFAKPFADAGSSDAESIRALVRGFDETTSNEDDPAAQYIHVRDARVYTGHAGPFSPDGMLWRGKVAAVDGFSLGHFQGDGVLQNA
jgi:hypothetical protein